MPSPLAWPLVDYVALAATGLIVVLGAVAAWLLERRSARTPGEQPPSSTGTSGRA